MSDNEYEPSISDSDNSDIDSVLEEDEDIKPIKINDDDIDIHSDIDSDIDVDKDDDEEDKEIEEDNIVSSFPDDMESDEDDDEYDEDYLKKFDENLQEKTIENYHPELHIHNYEEIETLSIIVRDINGYIIDPFHKTNPFLSRYEKARILGERAKQINEGAEPFIEIDETIIDGYLIASKELEQKKIPFIIQRPLPNGGCEYWKVSDLEVI